MIDIGSSRVSRNGCREREREREREACRGETYRKKGRGVPYPMPSLFFMLSKSEDLR
jgi:hypothetical protein